MLSGHVTYACPCLNIKIHLSSKYDLNKHASERQQYWFEQETPSIDGWLLELGMGAVVVAYSSLIETRTSPTSPWMTVGCLNCNTDNVYSIHNKASAPAPTQADESVVLHKDTLFGHQLDDIRKDDQFSDIFDIKLSDNSSSLVNQNQVPEQLKAQHQELYQVLEKALEKMRLASEVRIEQWKKVEMERLEKDSKKAKEESDRLWKKVLTVNQHNGITSGTASQATTPSVSEKPLSPPTAETPPPANTNESPKVKNSSQKASSQSIRFMDNGNESALLGSYRRSSFSLNESAIANSVSEQSNLLHAVNEQDPSSDEEDMFDLDEELSSFGDNPQQQQQQQEEGLEATSVGSSTQSIEIKPKLGSSQYGSSWIKKKRLSAKYIEDFATAHDDRDSKEDDKTQDLSRSVSAFATSMPININSPFLASPEKGSDNGPGSGPGNHNDDNTTAIKHSSKPNTISYTFAPTQTTSSTSFVGYDFSFSERALSKQFPDYNPERRRSVSTVSGRRHPQLDALIEKSSLDTRSMKK